MKTSDTIGLAEPFDRGLNASREEDEARGDNEAITEGMKDGGQEPTLSGVISPSRKKSELVLVTEIRTYPVTCLLSFQLIPNLENVLSTAAQRAERPSPSCRQFL